MTISISQIGELYVATATPPHVKGRWTSEPISAERLWFELQEQGAHQTDIGDAFYEADPDWAEKSDHEDKK